MSLRRHDEEPVTVTIERTVAPGRQREFEEWATQLNLTAAEFPGFLGAGLLHPGRPDQRRWHVVYRFDTREHLVGWEQSAVRQQLLRDADELVEATEIRQVSGLETWFSLPGRTAPAPPRWKMFLVSVVGIYSLQVIFHLGLDSFLEAWPLPLRVGALAACVTALMTWVVMPRLARALARWLYPSASGSAGRES